MYGGAKGGGKSHLIRVSSILYSLEIPYLQTFLFRRTYKDLKNNHWYGKEGFVGILKPFVDQGICKMNKADMEIVFSNGSVINLCHAQNEHDIENYDGSTIHHLIIDESTKFTPYQIKYIRGCVRLGNLEIPKQFEGMFPRILYATNPGGVSHNWHKQNFVDVGSHGGIWRSSQEDGYMKRQFIQAKMTDNPALMRGDPHYAKRVLASGDRRLVLAKLEGDWNIADGGMFSDVFNPEIHVLDLTKEELLSKSSFYIDRCYDYGQSAPFACIWFAMNNEPFELNGRTIPRGSIFGLSEIYGADENDDGLNMVAKDQAKWIKEIDASFKQTVHSGAADNSIFDTYNGVCIATDMNSEGVTWDRSDKSPGSRINGWAMIRQLLNNVDQNPMEYPGLYFLTSCPSSIKNIFSVERDKKKVEDIDTDSNDHQADVLRYKVLSMQRRITTSAIIGF